MKAGRIYEVFVDGIPVKLIGSTCRSLASRRSHGYVKRFGKTVELRLVREIPIPYGYDAKAYDLRLKAAESFDISRNKYYREDGGLNQESPLIQALWLPELQSEVGRLGGLRRVEMYPELSANLGRKWGPIGGKIGGQKNVESGHIRKLCLEHNQNTEHQKMASRASYAKRTPEFKAELGRRVGKWAVESGHLARLRTPEHQSKAGKIGSLIGNHNQHHRNKNKVNPKCKLCVDANRFFIDCLRGPIAIAVN